MRHAVLVAGVVAVLTLAAVVVQWLRAEEGPAPVAVPPVEGADLLSAQRRLAAPGLRLALEDPSARTVPDSPIASQRPTSPGHRSRGGRPCPCPCATIRSVEPRSGTTSMIRRGRGSRITAHRAAIRA